MVFRIEDMALGQEHRRLADAIRFHLVDRDISATGDTALRAKKQQWLDRWSKLFLPDAATVPKLGDCVKEFASATNRIQASIVVIDLTTFTPFLALGEEDDDEKKALAKCSLGDDVRFGVLGQLSEGLGLGADYPREMLKCFNSASGDLQGGFMRRIAFVAGGGFLVASAAALTATGIGAGIGALLGYSGAAAVSAGLALLGGGSIASGGFGVAGGIAVVVLGGGTLGGALGGGGDAVLRSLTRSAALSESAKLRVLMSEVLVKHQIDVALHQEVLRRQRERVHQLQDELDRLRVECAMAARVDESEAEAEALMERVNELELIIEVLCRGVELQLETTLAVVAAAPARPLLEGPR